MRILHSFIILLVYIQPQASNQEIGIRNTISSNVEVSGRVLDELVLDLQLQAESAVDDLVTNPTNTELIIQSMANQMSATIATLVQDLLSSGISNPLQEAAQISGALRIALQQSFVRENNLLTEADVAMIANQFVGEVELLLQNTKSNMEIAELTNRISVPLQDAILQGFGISSSSSQPSQTAMVSSVPMQIQTPTIFSSLAPIAAVQVSPPDQSTIAGGNVQTYIYTSQGQRVMVGGCFDIQPPGGFTCAEQDKLGKCGRRWMTEGMFCAQTCGYCENRCLDIQPDITTSCEQYKDLEQCNSQLLIDNDFCRKTCNRCKDGSIPETPSSQQSTSVPTTTPISTLTPTSTLTPQTQQGCVDIPPDDKYTCEQQRAFGKCEAIWLRSGGFCRRTCERCDEDILVPQQSPFDAEGQCACECQDNSVTSQQTLTVTNLLAEAIQKVLQDIEEQG